jgi:hypothetical protein
MSEARIERLTLGGRLPPAGGLLLLVSMWLPWFGTAPEDNPFIPPARNVTIDAWQSFDSIDAILLLAAVAAIAMPVLAFWSQQRGPEPRQLAPVFVLGALTAALVSYRMFEPIENTIVHYGAVIGLVATLVIAAGSLPGALYLIDRVRQTLWSPQASRPGSRGR